MAKYYRDAEQYRLERANEQAWLQGFYIYTALLNVSPVFNAMSKRKKPHRYLKEPIPITAHACSLAKEDANRRKLTEGKNAMLAMMKGINKRLRKGGVISGS